MCHPNSPSQLPWGEGRVAPGTPIHTQTHILSYFTLPSLPYMHAFGQWDEGRVPGEKPPTSCCARGINSQHCTTEPQPHLLWFVILVKLIRKEGQTVRSTVVTTSLSLLQCCCRFKLLRKADCPCATAALCSSTDLRNSSIKETLHLPSVSRWSAGYKNFSHDASGLDRKHLSFAKGKYQLEGAQYFNEFKE